MWIFQGMVFSPIPFQPDDLLAKHEAPAPDEAELAESVPRTSLVSTIAESFKQMLFPSCNASFLNFLHSVVFYYRFSVMCLVQRKNLMFKKKTLHFFVWL